MKISLDSVLLVSVIVQKSQVVLDFPPNMPLPLCTGLLSRVVKLRREMHGRGQQGPGGEPVWPLKLIIMSATLR